MPGWLTTARTIKDNIITGAKLANNTVTKSKAAVFFSTEQTGTGAAQNVAHGLGVMLEMREQAVARGLRFKVINVNQPLNRIFEITRLDSVFELNTRVEYAPVASRARLRPVAA